MRVRKQIAFIHHDVFNEQHQAIVDIFVQRGVVAVRRGQVVQSLDDILNRSASMVFQQKGDQNAMLGRRLQQHRHTFVDGMNPVFKASIVRVLFLGFHRRQPPRYHDHIDSVGGQLPHVSGENVFVGAGVHTELGVKCGTNIQWRCPRR